MRYRTGVAIVAATGVLWSTQGVLLRLISTPDTWSILVWRCLGTCLALTLVMALRSGPAGLRALGRVGVPGLIGGVGLVFAFAGSIYALQSTTIANAVFLYSAAPFFTAILGQVVLGERVRGATWAAMALAVLGMFIMVRDGLGTGALTGNIAATLSSAGFAVFTVTLRWRRQADALPTVITGAALSMLVGALIRGAEGQWPVLPAADVLIAMFIGVLHVGLGMVLYTLGSKVIPAAELTLLSQFEVLFSPLWAWIFLAETASPATFLGGAVLMTAVLWNGLTGARAGPARATP